MLFEKIGSTLLNTLLYSLSTLFGSLKRHTMITNLYEKVLRLEKGSPKSGLLALPMENLSISRPTAPKNAI